MSGSAPEGLRRVLRPIHLWAIAVGLVISGDYFGWNYGVPVAGPVGMGIALIAVTVMYVTFIFSYTELSTAIPHSGGPYAYARKALGPTGGFLAGFATLVEFVFAPPAIALAIGSYVNFRFGVPVLVTAIGAFAVFGLINVLGVGLAATFELVVTAVAAAELFLYFGLTAPHIDPSLILGEKLLPFGWTGVFAALPFAIWFYLALEGVAMSAEEVVNPKKDIPKGYIAGITTLVLLATGTLVCTTGVLPMDEIANDDSPLPRALAKVLHADHPMTHMMVYLGLFGLIASFHGIMMGYSRQVFALARADYLPKSLAKLHPRFRTPYLAIIAPGFVGILGVVSGQADKLIMLAVLGAVSLYVISMVSLFVLRKNHPTLERPWRAPFYPVFPAIALVLASGVFVAIAALNALIFGLFVVMLIAGYGYFRLVTLPRLKPEEEGDVVPAIE